MEQKTKLLLAEDDENLGLLLKEYLIAKGFDADLYPDGEAAYKGFMKEHYDICILDVMMPKKDGFTLAKDIRIVNADIPVLFLTAKNMKEDVLEGFKIGADDYITKPFSLSVLRARVNTQLRKQASNKKNAPFHMDLFHFDFEAMTFYVGDSKVELSKTEQKLLRLLVENRGRTMTRGDLVDRIWTDGAEYVDENALSVTIKRLRDKLGAQKYIKTVYGIGYSWVTKDE